MEGSSDVVLDSQQPELLEKNTILNILLERELKIDNLQGLPKNELVKIYKSYILPLPQRRRPQSLHSNKSRKIEHDVNEISMSAKKIKIDTNTTESRKRVNNDFLECEKDASGIKRKKQMIKWP